MKRIFSVLILTAILALSVPVAARGPFGHVWRDMDSVPAATDDRASGYREGDIWIVGGSDTVYFCADDTIGAAVWTNGGGDYIYGYMTITGDLDVSGVSTLRVDMTSLTISSGTTLTMGGMYLVDTSSDDVAIQLMLPTAQGAVSEFSFLRDGICGVSVWVTSGHSIDMPGKSGTTAENSLLTETGARFNALCSGNSVFYRGTGTIYLW